MIGRSAKSHQYYYYTCNGNFKQETETCIARALPKDRLERVIVEQIREKVLNNEWLQELVELVNKKLRSSHTLLGDRLDAIDTDLNEVRLRLSKLYESWRLANCLLMIWRCESKSREREKVNSAKRGCGQKRKCWCKGQVMSTGR